MPDPAPDDPSQQDAPKDSAAPAERRRFQRIPFDGEAIVIAGEQQWSVALVDVSLRGALVIGPDAWRGRPVDTCTLRIALQDGSEIVMSTRVAHAEGARLGLQCLEIDVDSIARLRRMVELNCGDPALLQRELAALF